MGFYDANPLLGIQQQGNQEAMQIGMAQLQQPRPADVFLDRLRQAKQDQLHKSQFDLNMLFKGSQMQKMQQDAESRAEQADAAKRRADTYQQIQPRLAEVKQQLADSVSALNATKDERIKARMQPEVDKLVAEHDRLVSAAANLDSEAANRDYLSPIKGNLMNAQADRAMNYRPETAFGGVGGVGGMSVKGLDAYNKWISAAQENHRKAAKDFNDQNAIQIMQGKVKPMNPELSEEDAANLIGSRVGGAMSPVQAPRAPGAGQMPSPLAPSAQPRSRMSAGGKANPSGLGDIKLKIKTMGPTNYQDASGKDLWKIGGDMFYADGTKYVPPQQ